jgi:predicted small metal-binding protein
MDGTTYRVRCACGWEARGTEAEVVDAATEHGRRIHNMTPSRDEVLAMVELDVHQKPGPLGRGT